MFWAGSIGLRACAVTRLRRRGRLRYPEQNDSTSAQRFELHPDRALDSTEGHSTPDARGDLAVSGHGAVGRPAPNGECALGVPPLGRNAAVPAAGAKLQTAGTAAFLGLTKTASCTRARCASTNQGLRVNIPNPCLVSDTRQQRAS
jgi:hypothetical protein